MAFYKNKWFKGGLVVLGLVFSFGLGNSGAKIGLEEDKVNYTQLQDKIKGAEGQLQAKQDELKEAKDVIGKKDSAEADLKKVNDDISVKQGELKLVESVLAEKRAELATIESGIKEKKDAPKVLPAGQFIVGKDIPKGRYKVTTNGTRGSNFKVYDSSGSLVINTIISSLEGHGVKEYIALMGDGYIIDARDTFKYIPVE